MELEKEVFQIDEFSFETDEAQASVGSNPTYRWCKFVLTDDMPNANNHRIPEEEFDNLIKTGLYAPVKMAAGRIEKGHDNAIPLGTITSLKKSGNKILGLAALWTEERKDDIELIKKQYDEGHAVNLSWEVLYEKSSMEDNGVKALLNTALRATTIVALPAYQGRTPILQVASTEGNKLDLDQALAKIAELEASLVSTQAELTQKVEELNSVKTEKEELASYKAGIETELAKAEKLQAIKNKFKEAGIEKEDQYFSDNAEHLLTMGDAEFDFMLQEFVSFAAKINDAKASVEVPVIISSTSKLSAKEIAKRLRNLK